MEKGLWFHAHLAFEVIPGTWRRTLIKCLWCVDHTCRGVCSKECYCEFWLPWSPWHNLPLCCVQHFAVMTRLKCWVEEDNLWLGHRPPPLLRITLDHCTAESIFRAAFSQRGRRGEKLDSMLWSAGPYYRFMSLFQPALLRKADYLHLQGSVGLLDVSQHFFIALV